MSISEELEEYFSASIDEWCGRETCPKGCSSGAELIRKVTKLERRDWAVRVLDAKFGTSWHMSTRDITHTVWGMGYEPGDQVPKRIASGLTIAAARIAAAEALVAEDPTLGEGL